MLLFFKSTRGFALISVVWVVLLLALLASGVMQLLVVSKRSVAQQGEEIQDRYLAESAVDTFMRGFFYDSKEQTYQDASFTLLGTKVSIIVEFEGGKIDLNKANFPTLSALFASKGVDHTTASSLAAAIVDWRDVNDVPVSHGAESEIYAAAGSRYRPRNGAFETVGELLYVHGFTEPMFRCVASDITVYSLNGNVDIPRAKQSVRDVLTWAYTNDWMEENWPAPSDSEFSASPNSISDIGGQALKLKVFIGEAGEKTYEQIVRFKTLSNKSDYARLTPLVAVSIDSQDGCSWL